MRPLNLVQTTLGALARDCTLGVLGSIWRDRPFHEVARAFDARPRAQRVLITTAVIVGLLAGSLLFAQAGFVGIAAYLALIFLLIK